ncbi:MAG: hypothetical protein JOZ07_06775 [Solirubrobacterales bacterium]|nr:hypothetical protein [Solirubrobacterales bacterium]
MSQGAQLMLWIAGVHLVGLVCVAVLMFPALRDAPPTPTPRRDDGEDGWGRGPRPPAPKPGPSGGGIPLPDARPANVRLREPGRLFDHLPQRERRPAREPVRTPERVG